MPKWEQDIRDLEGIVAGTGVLVIASLDLLPAKGFDGKSGFFFGGIEAFEFAPLETGE